jgi:hypothetical protein
MVTAMSLDKCGEFPASEALLGMGAGIDLGRGDYFLVTEWPKLGISEPALAARLASLCDFED